MAAAGSRTSRKPPDFSGIEKKPQTRGSLQGLSWFFKKMSPGGPYLKAASSLPSLLNVLMGSSA
jgi:hypothetical protein